MSDFTNNPSRSLKNLISGILMKLKWIIDAVQGSFLIQYSEINNPGFVVKKC